MRKLNYHRTTEVYFIGYPKTGNTWVRFLLGHYIQLLTDDPQLHLFDGTDWLGRCERGWVGPAMQFTHQPLTWKSQTADDLNEANVVRPFLKKKVVLIVRHPLDALVSAWFQQQYRTKSGFSGTLEHFLDHPVFGLEKFCQFYRLWAEAADRVPAFFLLRYEDIKSDPEKHFLEVIKFLEISQDTDILQHAIKNASFDSMKKLEQSGDVPRYQSSGLSIFATGDKNNPDAFHVRRGETGGYKDYLEADMIQSYEQRIARSMGNVYGYGG